MKLETIVMNALDTFEQPNGDFDVLEYVDHIKNKIKQYYPKCNVFVDTHPDETVDIEDEYEPEDFIHAQMVEHKISADQLVNWYIGYDDSGVLLTVIINK